MTGQIETQLIADIVLGTGLFLLMQRLTYHPVHGLFRAMLLFATGKYEESQYASGPGKTQENMTTKTKSSNKSLSRKDVTSARTSPVDETQKMQSQVTANGDSALSMTSVKTSSGNSNYNPSVSTS